MTSRQAEPSSPADASVGQLVERLSAQVSTLIRDEMTLATAEMKRKSARAGVGIGIGSVGALLALYGLGALIAAAVQGLAHALVAWLPTVVIGAALLLVAGVISASSTAARGRNQQAAGEYVIKSGCLTVPVAAVAGCPARRAAARWW